MDLTVDADRLRDDIEATAAFGDIDADEGHGRTVLVGSEANRRAREYLLDRMDAADLDVTVDAVGNIAGTWTPDGADPDAAPVAAGSHLDSVPEGGIFDGPLGVYAALEAVRAMQDAGVSPDRPVTVVSFTEEEGQRFADGLLGSSVAVGERSVEEALALTNDDGVTLADGRRLLVYNHSTRTQPGMGRKGRGVLNVAVSEDGTDWEAALVLEHLDGEDKQFSYPAVVQTRDGLVHVTYTWHRERIKHVVLDPDRLTTTPMPHGTWPHLGEHSIQAFKRRGTDETGT